MIVDFDRFLMNESPYWDELDTLLKGVEDEPAGGLPLESIRRYHFLYHRALSSLAQLKAFPGERQVRHRLENLVARAYANINDGRAQSHRFRPAEWFLRDVPQTFRRHFAAFGVVIAVTLAGSLLGAFGVAFDPDSKAVIMPFEHLQGNPSDRVAEEETRTEDRMEGHALPFSTQLMTHNIRVAILAMALGVTFGFGTLLLIFYNGIILGAVVCDYVLAGEAVFVAGWLLPHGAVEIPAILIAGQAGFVLGRALIGRGDHAPVAERLRAIRGDLVTLIACVAVMLVWAGIIEAFLSQYHEPVIPYSAKIIFGVLELLVLCAFFGRAGRNSRHA